MAQIPGPEDHQGIFERSHKEKRIDRILEAATRANVRQAEKAKPLRAIKPLIRSSKNDLGKVLERALGSHVKGKRKASVRAKNADGARSFHFEAYYTSRDDAAREAYKQKHRESSSRLADWAADRKTAPHATSLQGGGGGSRGGDFGGDASGSGGPATGAPGAART